MVKKGLILMLCLSCAGPLWSQELIPDPGFEIKTYCPSDYNLQKLKNLTHWYQPTDGTPDYFHDCSTKMGIPKNMFGEQEAFAGEAYAGLVLFSPSKKNYREYLQVKLSRPLSAGEQVCVEVSLSPADRSQYICDGFGVHLSKDKIKGDRTLILPVEGQMDNPKLHLIDGFDEWVTISDLVEANGGEEYLTLGNFRPDRSTKVLRRTEEEGLVLDYEMAYVYIDEVRVFPVKERSECSCLNDVIAAEVKDPPLQLEESRSIEFRNVLFEFDQSELSADAKKELSEVARYMKRKSSLYLEIIGHADLIGPSGYNLDLSRERAEKVIGFLVAGGVQESRLSIRYYGAERPVADNATDEGRALNRRVEFEIRQKRYELVD